MALAEVGRQIAGAFEKMTVEDEEECLDEISRALLQAHVPADLVHKFSVHVKMDRNLMQQAVFYELCALLEQGELVDTPEKGRQCIVMFVGLQDSGKTTTCTKYALYYQKKGWKPSLICADTSRPGAYEQLKQNAVKANIPFFGSYSELDPVTITKQGIEKFKKNSDLIIVDTSGHHKQEASLFKEIHGVSEMMSPDLIVSVIDGNIGQAAFDQVQVFKQHVPVGAVIVTKMDGQSKGVGTLSSVAAANSPVIFFGTGEHMDDFEQFKVKTFVSRLLGQQDGSRFLRKMRLVPMDEQPKCHQDFVEESITLRRLYNEYQSKSRIGPLDQLFPKITGIMPEYHDNENDARMKKFMMIMESMSDAELDEPNPKMLLKQSRVNKIVRRSGHTTNDVHELLAEFRRWTQLARVRKVSKKALQYVNEPQLLKTDKLLWKGLKDVGPSSALHLHRTL